VTGTVVTGDTVARYVVTGEVVTGYCSNWKSSDKVYSD
jgi:hypothetical protein